MIDPQIYTDFQASPNLKDGEDRYNELLVHSATDREFRQTLLNDPMTAIASFTGQEIPDEIRSLDIRFVENEADVTIVLPDPIAPEHELSDEELESVAGGSVAITLTAFSTPACASALISIVAVVAAYNVTRS